MAEFIDGLGTQIPLPWQFTNWKMQLFILTGNQDNLQEICDKFLNIDPSGDLRFEPVGSKVFLQLNDYESIRSTTPPNSTQGFISTCEIFFTFMVRQVGDSTDGQGIMYFAPFVLIEDSWSVISLQTIIGFPMCGCSFVAQQDDDDASVTASTLVYPTFSPQTEAVIEPLLEIVGDLTLADEVTDQQADPTVLGHAGSHELGISRTSESVVLKQFRSITNATEACYQKIVSFPLDSTTVGFSFIKRPDITLNAYDSLDIAGALGLETKDDGTLKISWPATTFTMDATMNFGEVLYAAP